MYGGVDPLTQRPIYLRETIAPGPRAQAEAERGLTRLLSQVDEKRHPRTSATVDQLLDIAGVTKSGYESIIRKHIHPMLGSLKVSRLGADALESFYAELRRCRDHCDGRPFVQHRTAEQHDCDPHPRATCKPADPACRHCRRICAPHVCRSLSKSSIRQIHWILSGALTSAVRWGWIAVNPAEQAKRPERDPAKPRPPSATDAARLIESAARRDPDWGAFIWVTTTTGARRGEMCALHWEDVDLANMVLHLHRAIGETGDGWIEKDTKTHQDRRVVLDHETVDVLRKHLLRCQERASSLGVELPREAYVFSRDPGGTRSWVPRSVTQRYDRMAKQLGVKTTLHKLRHYSATELINAGVDVRTVAGRLGHGGGGATTLRVYAAWLSEADQRAAAALAGRMPVNGSTAAAEPDPNKWDRREHEPSGPYAAIATDLRGAIRSGVLRPGQQLPTVKDLGIRYGVSSATAHRAVQLLKDEGLVSASRGRRAIVT